MKILYTATAYAPSVGGAQIHLHELVKCMRSFGHSVSAVAFWNETRTDWLLGTTLLLPSSRKSYNVDGVRVNLLDTCLREKIFLTPAVLSYPLLQGWSLRQISELYERKLQSICPQVDIIHNTRIGREVTSLASYRLARKRRVRFILTCNHHPRWKGWFYRHYSWLYRNADALIALTTAEKNTLIALGVSPQKVFVTGIGPVVSPQAYPQRFIDRYGISGPMVLFLGQKYQYKNFAEILRAAPLVWQKNPGANFVFIGPRTRYSRKLFSKINDKRIIELDAIDIQTKTDALAACALLCLPSTQESFGGVFLEAWSFKKPVIGADIVSVRDVISQGNDGLLVSAGTAMHKDLALKINTLLQDSSLAEQLGSNGFRKVSQYYNWNTIAKNTESVYKSLL